LSAASAGGAMLVSVLLGITNTFTTFVFFSAIVTVIGSSLLFLLGRVPPAEDLGERKAPLKGPAAIVEEPA
jgi:membrane protein implicated in regulation of membrane protease activity